MGLVAYFLWRLRDRFQPGVLFAIYLVLRRPRASFEFIRRNDADVSSASRSRTHSAWRW